MNNTVRITTRYKRLALLGVAIVLSLTLPASGAGPTISDIGSDPGGPIIEAKNTAAGSGVEGIAQVGGGIGVLGLSQTTGAASGFNIGAEGAATGTGSYGLYGVATSTDTSSSSTQSIGVLGVSHNSNGLYGRTFRQNVPAVIAYNPNGSIGTGLLSIGSGNAIVSQSSVLNGVLGSTRYNSGQSGSGYAGILGEDLSNDSGIGNSGVAGTSASGYGITGTATAEGTGAAGFSAAGVGVFGTSVLDYALYGLSTNSAGTAGYSLNDIGVVAVSLAAPDSTGNGSPALQVATEGGAPAMKVTGPGGDIMSLDASGNLIVSGNVTIDGNLSVAGSTGACPSCPTPLVVHRQATAARVTVGTYDVQQTVRTVDDVGEAQLSNGQAYVRLDPAFAASIDPGSDYLVLITPQGDSRGLYVTQKTHAGFVVHENMSGRSSLAFDYHITAKPFGPATPRLPLMSATALRAGAATARPLHTKAAVLAMLRKRLHQPRALPRGGTGFIPALTKRPAR